MKYTYDNKCNHIAMLCPKCEGTGNSYIVGYQIVDKSTYDKVMIIASELCEIDEHCCDYCDGDKEIVAHQNYSNSEQKEINWQQYTQRDDDAYDCLYDIV